jgi:ElaB/YqjD/DUF883 family membrane-anchored ribosome-binding protein
MAETLSPEELRKDYDKQIADLKKEVRNLTKALAEHSSETYEKARDAADDALTSLKGHARGAVQQARSQAQVVSDTVRENPGTAATVLSSAGIIGFVLGIVVGVAVVGNPRS